jgi:hypothetical protein
MKFFLKLESSDPDTVDSFTVGRTEDLGSGVLECVGTSRKRSGGAEQVILFALSVPLNVATSLLANQIAEYFRRRTQHGKGSIRLSITAEPEDPTAWVDIHMPIAPNSIKAVNDLIEQGVQRGTSTGA